MSPIFLVPEIDGAIDPIQRLANLLPSTIPVHVLPNPHGTQSGSIERRAAEHVAAIERTFPRGACRLLGHASGGAVAYEIAAQLAGRDRAVQFAGMVDSQWPGSEQYCPIPIDAPTHLFLTTGNEAPAWRALLGRSLVTHRLPSAGSAAAAAEIASAIALAAADTASIDLPHSSDYAPVIPLVLNNRSAPTIFAIPGAGSSVTSFSELASLLEERVNLYGLQHRGLAGGLAPHCSVEAAASLYERAIRETCKTGPYHLLGHSFGGWVAFEIAARLRAGGESVATLVLIDSDGPSEEGELFGEHGRIRMLEELIDVIEESSGKCLHYTATDLRRLDADGQVLGLAERMKRVQILPRNAKTADVELLVRVFSRHFNATYRPARALDVNVLLISAGEERATTGERSRKKEPDDGDTRDAAEVWSGFTPRLGRITVPGNHMTMLQMPHLERIAEAIVEVWGLGSLRSHALR